MQLTKISDLDPSSPTWRPAHDPGPPLRRDDLGTKLGAYLFPQLDDDRGL